MDWDEFAVNHRDEWLDCLRATFEGLSAGSGRIGVQELVALLAANAALLTTSAGGGCCCCCSCDGC